MGERRADITPRKLILGFQREMGRHQKAPLDPMPLAGQQLSDSGHRQVIVLRQGFHHTPFIECGDRPGGRVGHEHEPFVVDGAQGSLDDGLDVSVTGLEPSEELLESIKDLVEAVVRGYDPQRGVGQLGSVRSKVPRPKRGVARADQLNRKVADRPR